MKLLDSTSHDVSSKYKVRNIDHEIPIDCDWTKGEWQKSEELKIPHDNGWTMDFRPEAKAKICYNENYIYVIYRVQDNFVRCVIDKTNGEVWKDSCVEFFFAPDENKPRSYFNLEINCGGTIRLGYQKVPRVDAVLIKEDDIKQIKVCHSLPATIEKEIISPLEWIIEVALPFTMLNRYSPMNTPSSGFRWKANFYKCAENNSHPHWLSWTTIDSPSPNFHLPEHFGEVEFE